MKASDALEIRLHLKSYQDSMLSLLEQLVRYESPSSNRSAQGPLLSLLSGELEKIDFRPITVPRQDSGGYLFAVRRNRVKQVPLQLLVGHCDTVWPVGTIESMPCYRQNGRMYGPGIFDMKAGLTQMIYALRTIFELQRPLLLEPVLLINSDEEIGSHDSTATIRRLARIAERAFILEPPLGNIGRLKTERKGLTRLTMKIMGKAAHAGLNPEQGVSAIEELSYQVQRLFQLNNPETGISINVGMIEGGISPNTIAPQSKAIIDVRTVTKKDSLEIIDRIRAFKPHNPEVTLTVSGKLGRMPMESNKRNRKLWLQARAAGTLLGLRLEQGRSGGGSDGNTTSQFTATLDGLGAPGGGAHASDEFIVVDQLVERTALLTLLLLNPK
ncbi:MAG: M20 family metallopeptidase [Saprospiraceae bacterium]|nr:M20 family metallopeptidase [Saprospiraceae bacterium]